MENNKNDIPLQAAHNAHAWTSMDPDKRAEQEQAGAADIVAAAIRAATEEPQ